MITIESLDSIIDDSHNNTTTYRQLIDAQGIPADAVVPYGPDMFLLSPPIIEKYGFAVAGNMDGNYLVALKYTGTSYIHRYTYSGGVDMWFLNQYDCLLLYDCNEFSVELCQTALKLWTGKRLILMGRNWEPMIEFLDDLPGVECFYEPSMESMSLANLMHGCKYLLVTYGIPHQESMERYNQCVMYYDEVMSFTFMFSDYRQLGELNPDKNFFVMDGYYNKLGLFTIFSKVETCLRYAKSKGMIPVVKLTMSDRSFYSNYDGDDIWGKFFNQPENYTLDEVMHSKNVFFCPGLYNGSIQSDIMNRSAANVALTWPNGIFNDNILKYIDDRRTAFLPYPEKTLGVLARGTDFVNTHLPNHAIHASKEMLSEKIDEAMQSWKKLEYIYIATEDASYCEYFKATYGDRVFFTDQQRYTIGKNELLSEHHRKEPNRRDGFLFGAEYAASIILLSECNSLIASGGCSGLCEALKQNGGKYENVYIFDLGVNV